MADRWNFLMIAGEGGAESHVRFKVQDVASGASAEVQFEVSGTEVPLGDEPVDYEAPEWKAKKVMAESGCSEQAFDALKRDVRTRMA